MKHVIRAILALSLVLVIPEALLAQFETASVLGYVRDPSDALISGTTVTLTDQQTKAQVTAQTNAQGSYEFTDVKIGQYEISAKANGFDVSTTQPFTVTVNARQRVDVALKVGSNNETVTVDAAASLLETDSSERGQVIDRREVENLPLNGRAYADLAALVPGVRRNILENSTDSSRDASFNVNGQRSEFNNFLLDGLDNNAYGTSNQGFSNQAIPASPDAISEFRVETDNYSAEYGRSAGAVVNVSIRSGTNNFHGTAYDYIRNTVFNAIGPFTPPTNPLTGAPQKPILIRNQFGGTMGGPVFKDKLFFFGDYEGTRQIVHAINQATVPTLDQDGRSALALANGGYTFLSGSSSENGAAVPLINPLTGVTYPTGIIPFNDPAVSSFAKGVLLALPSANVPGSPYANNYASLPPDTIHDDKGDIRMDYTLSQKTTAFFRYSEHQGIIASPPVIQGPAGGNSNGNVHIFNQQAAGGVTHLFSQNAILDARFAFTLTDGGKSPFGANLASLETGIPGLPTSPTVARSLNVQSVSGFSQFGNQGSNPQFQNPTVYNPKINFTLLRGRNQLKFGYEYQTVVTEIDDFNPVYGQDTYNGGYSNGAANASGSQLSSSNTGTKEAVALADFIFGARDTYQLNNFVIVHLNQRYNFMYVQDDIRANSRLTINAGLRYELVTPQWESNNMLANYNPATQSLVLATSGSLYNRALVNMPLLDLAPRFGLAYAVDSKTVIRAAYGINYAQFNREGGENLLVYNLPAIVNSSVTQIPAFAAPGVRGASAGLAPCTAAQATAPFNPANPTPCFLTTSQGYPTNFASPSNVTAASNISTQARYIPKDLPTGYVQGYHLTVQRQIGPTTTFEASYVGEHGVKLETLADLNQAAPNAVTATCNTTTTSGCLSLQARRPIPTFTTIEETLPAGLLYYNALQTKLEHRTSHGLYLLNSFTWSRAEDNAAGHLDTPDGDNSRINLANPLGEIGPSAYNQPLNETLSIVYDLPYGKGRMFGDNAPLALREALGGWQLTVINDVNSGLPVNVTYSPNSFQQVSPLLVQRPNQAPGNPGLPKSQRIKLPGNQNLLALQNPVFMSVANPIFSLPTVNQPYGNAGRNSVRFDPYYNLDLGLHKQFPIYREGVSFDFRAEAFNVLNLTNYAFPSSAYSPSSSSFGVVAAASTFPARVLQFAGKIIF
jgi:hypothetical protein